jgi:hypothetical protein
MEVPWRTSAPSDRVQALLPLIASLEVPSEDLWMDWAVAETLCAAFSDPDFAPRAVIKKKVSPIRRILPTCRAA